MENNTTSFNPHRPLTMEEYRLSKDEARARTQSSTYFRTLSAHDCDALIQQRKQQLKTEFANGVLSVYEAFQAIPLIVVLAEKFGPVVGM
eukprot:43137-Eustigmatos_ZCMA.PRE.1